MSVIRGFKVAAAVVVVTCSLQMGGNAVAAPPTTDVQILAKGFMFTPTKLTVKAGTRVRWVNQDEEPHTVVSADGLFRSGALDTKDSFSYTFKKPGTYRFICSIHPQMVGTVVVEQ
jgi:plastocyanin